MFGLLMKWSHTSSWRRHVFSTYKRRNGNLLRYQCLISKCMEIKQIEFGKIGKVAVFFSPRTHIVRRFQNVWGIPYAPWRPAKTYGSWNCKEILWPKCLSVEPCAAFFLHWILSPVRLCFFFQFFEGGMVGRFGVFQILPPQKMFFCASFFFWLFFFGVTPLNSGNFFGKTRSLALWVKLGLLLLKKCP